MLSDNHFYHSAIRRTISVFGTIFNDINLIKTDSLGNVLNISKVPLAYGPRAKFLSRINDDTTGIAIKVPRMSFELTGLTYEPTLNHTRTKKRVSVVDGSDDTKQYNYTPASYRLTIQLNILAKQQDDALQIVEQIIPYFTPDFTVTVKEVGGAYKADIPFVLQSISPEIEYEGDYLTKSTIIYALEFETLVHFHGPTELGSLITKTIISTGICDSAGTNTVLTRKTTEAVGGPLDEPTQIVTFDENLAFD